MRASFEVANLWDVSPATQQVNGGGCARTIQLTHRLESAWFQPLNLKSEKCMPDLSGLYLG
jgi:hypothetical protein